MISITRKLTFEAGHRVYGHESKCAHLHGHSYKVYITVASRNNLNGLDNLGRVIDFSCIKDIVGKWIDDNFDHALLLYCEDPLLELLTRPGMDVQKVYSMPFNPTAENIAAFLMGKAISLLPSAVQVIKVKVFETENCSAEFTGLDRL